jgi:predicted alpha/beta superfamily hydrolase
MKLVLFLILIIVMAVANARTIKKWVQIGKAYSIFSSILNEKRKLWVCVPKVADEPVIASIKYPVVYLLDAEDHFSSFTKMIQQVNKDGSKLFPDMIVVGIPNTRRVRDLTPTHSEIDADGKKENDFKSSGGGEKFIEFIEKELIPHIDSTYPATSDRILIGHSLGGLTAVNILINHTALFNGYIASDPSMWWEDQLLLKQASALPNEKRFDGKSLYLSIANTLPARMDIKQVRDDVSPQTNHARSILELVDILERNHDNGLRFDYKYYKDEDHSSVPKITAYDGLRFLLG